MGLLIDGALTASSPFHLTVVFFAGYLSLNFGIADFVLYIWVDDVFVRRNKSHSSILKLQGQNGQQVELGPGPWSKGK